MNFADFYGSYLMPGKRWTPFTEVSGPNVGQTPPEELRVDPFLPAQSIDPYDPAGGIAIPAGRFVSIGYALGVAGVGYGTGGTATTPNAYRMGQGDRGYTSLTLHEGKNLTPVGMSVNNIFRSASTNASGNQTSSGPFQNPGNQFSTDSGASATDVKFRRGFVAELPFVLSINNAHGSILSGDRVSGFWGNTTSTSDIGWIHRGKAVKWVAKQLNYQSFTASGTVALTAAIYPGFTPRVVAMYNASGVVTGTPTYTFDGTQWVAALPGTCTQVFYEYGQAADQVAGEVLRIQSLQDIMDRDSLFKFVELSRNDFLNFPPPASQLVAITQRTNESASSVSTNVYRVQNWPVSINHAVTIQIQGTVIDDTGTSTTYSSSSWYTLPQGSSLDLRGYFAGKYHTMNWRTGVIEISENITLTAVRVTYCSVTDRRLGAVLWGQGILGLTDGRYLTTPSNDASGLVPGASSRAGVPAHLNYADVVGAMRLIVEN